MSKEILDNIIISENAYFYTKKDKAVFDSRFIKKAFREILNKKSGKELLKIEEEEIKLKKKVLQFSCLVFKYKHKPTFIEDPIADWYEMKLAYLYYCKN